jgi:hypothetical protein
MIIIQELYVAAAGLHSVLVTATDALQVSNFFPVSPLAGIKIHCFGRRMVISVPTTEIRSFGRYKR